MKIYILKHPKAGFSGYFCAAEFFEGRGSTSSAQDRDRLVKLGCKDITDKYWADKKKAEAKTKTKEKKDEVKSGKK